MLFRKALKIAKEQKAKLWELRAAMSLAQLHRNRGRSTEAHDLLAPVYDSFTEGFATSDLKAAKLLLRELAAPQYQRRVATAPGYSASSNDPGRRRREREAVIKV